MSNKADRQLGLIYVISAPSGAGKTSLVKQLLQHIDNVDVCISHTTRVARDHEQNNEDYYFVSKDEFIELKRHDAFIEDAKVFDNCYATSEMEVERITSLGHDVILEIDWQGARQVKALYSRRTVSIFILPPSLEVLNERLHNRAQDNTTIIAARMAKAKNEISHCHEYKYMIVNDIFDNALADLIAIFKVERLKRQQLFKVNKLVTKLLS